MKTYKVLRGYAPVGEAGTTFKRKEDKFIRNLLKSEIIAEIKVQEPEEKKTRKPRAKKAD